MNQEAVFHAACKRYVYAESRESLRFSIRCGQSDLIRCELVYWPRTSKADQKRVKMQLLFRDRYFDYYECSIRYSKVARYQKYYFILTDTHGQEWYYNRYGLWEEPPEDGYFEYLYTNEGDCIKTPQGWEGTIFYQIFPDRFFNGNKKNDPVGTVAWGSLPTRENFMGGDLAGITRKIDYLSELGVECLYLNPIFEGDFNHKYATTNYYQIAHEFGTEKDMKELMEKAHEKKIMIVLDGVFNHTGTHFPPFEDIKNNQEQSRYKNWFYITEYPMAITHQDYECVGAYKWMPKLNTSDPEVRNYLIQIMKYWAEEYHIDGWRFDVADEVDELLWQEARQILKTEHPDFLLLGETWGTGTELLKENELDSIMNYTFRDAMRDYFAKDSINCSELDHRLNQMLAMYRKDTRNLLFNLLDSHDTERFLTLCRNDKARWKLAAAFLFLFPGAPSIYYGDEVGISGENDPDCRKAMIWEEEQQDRDSFAWYQWLISLRKKEPVLRTGQYYTCMCDNANDIFGFLRIQDTQVLYAMFHKGDKNVLVQLPVLTLGDYENVKSGERITAQKLCGSEACYHQDILAYEGVVTMTLAPYSMIVIKKMSGGKNHEKE